MALKDDVKLALRITSSAFDTEIDDLINYAKADLQVSGILKAKIDAFTADPSTDPLIKRAVVTYCKAEFGFDNPDRDDFRLAYESQKMRLTLVDSYITEVV